MVTCSWATESSSWHTLTLISFPDSWTKVAPSAVPAYRRSPRENCQIKKNVQKKLVKKKLSTVPDTKQMYKKEMFKKVMYKKKCTKNKCTKKRRQCRANLQIFSDFFFIHCTFLDFFSFCFCLGNSILRRIYYTLSVYICNADGACGAGGGAREEEGGGGRVDASRCGFVLPVRR